MNNIQHKILTSVAVLLFLLCSCVKEHMITTEEEQDAVITFDVTNTRGPMEDGDAEDRAIGSLRVLGFRSSDGVLTFNRTVTLSGTPLQGTITARTGRHTVVFIANEGSDPVLAGTLAGLTPGSSTLASVKGLSFSQSAFAANKNIPMSAIKENIRIIGDNELEDPVSGAAIPWSVTLVRLGIRVDLILRIPNAQATVWETGGKTISFGNVPDKAYIFPGIQNWTSPVSDIPFTVGVTGTPDGADHTKYVLPRMIILPELCSNHPTVPILDADALTLKLNDGANRSGVIDTNIPAMGNTLPRNTRLEVTATVATNTANLNFVIVVTSWDDIDTDHKLQ